MLNLPWINKSIREHLFCKLFCPHYHCLYVCHSGGYTLLLISTLANVAIFSLILIVLFTIFYIWQKKSDKKTVDEMAQDTAPSAA